MKNKGQSLGQIIPVLMSLLISIGIGSYVVDENFRDSVNTTFESSSDFIGDFFSSILELFGFSSDFLNNIFAFTLGFLLEFVEFGLMGFTLLISILSLVLQLLLFLISHTYLFLLMIEFFILAFAIQEKTLMGKINALLEGHKGLFMFGFTLIGFLFHLPAFLKDIYDSIRNIIMDIWRILNDLIEKIPFI